MNNSLDDHTLAWIIHYIDGQAIVKSIQQLIGSTSSSLYHVSLEKEHEVVDVVAA